MTAIASSACRPLPWELPKAQPARRGYLEREVLRATAIIPRARSHANESASLERVAHQLAELFSSGQVGQARAILAQLTRAQRNDQRIAKWERALSPPKVRLGEPGRTPSVEKNAAWLRSNGRAYAGQWVALRDGSLVGHHFDQAVLHRELEARGELDGVLFVRLMSG